MTRTLVQLADQAGLGFTQEDIGTLVDADIAYRGWWAPDVVHPLYAVAPLTASREEFLERAVSLYKLMELLKPAPLRALARQLGVPKEQIRDFGTLKLLACICQLSMIAKEHGYSLSEDGNAVMPHWSPTEKLPEMQTIFALNGLRVSQSHTPGNERETKIAAAVGVFGVDIAATVSGWGYATDALYDRLFEDISAISQLIRDAAYGAV